MSEVIGRYDFMILFDVLLLFLQNGETKDGRVVSETERQTFDSCCA